MKPKGTELIFETTEGTFFAVFFPDKNHWIVSKVEKRLLSPGWYKVEWEHADPTTQTFKVREVSLGRRPKLSQVKENGKVHQVKVETLGGKTIKLGNMKGIIHLGEFWVEEVRAKRGLN